MIVAVLWGSLVLVAALFLCYFLFFFRQLRSLPYHVKGILYKVDCPEYATAPVSVIICARNEAAHLQEALSEILEADYQWPDGSNAYELIVVDDCSTDHTADLLQDFSARYSSLRTVTITPDQHRTLPGKKFPLSLGLAAARHEFIVCTDADCSPTHIAWLHYMVAPLLRGKQIVAGYGGFYRGPGLLNRFIRFETAHTFLQYYSFTKSGYPYMAVGRNLAATKAVFAKASAYPVWSRLPSGDDDLLVQLCATGENMEVVAHPASFTRSHTKKTWSEYLRQKQRHVSTGKFYSARSKGILGIYALTHALWWLLLLSCILTAMPLVAFVILLLPMLVWATMFWLGSINLREGIGVLDWLLFSLCWVVYNAVLAPYILWKTKQRWT